MGRNQISCAKVLKFIREASNVSYSEIEKAFAFGYTDRGNVRHALSQLQDAGLIDVREGSYHATDHWTKLQGLLGISLSTLTEAEEQSGSAITVKPIFHRPTRSLIPPEAFVLMPFVPELRPVYDDHIKKVATRVGLSVARADDFFSIHAIMHDIWSALYNSRVVVADCTGRNANVFYEIGIAHTLGKPVVLITQSALDVPFDLRAIRYIEYAYTPPGMLAFEERLQKTIGELLKTDQ